MGIDGSAGLVTRGFGADHKILTRGFGARLDLGGFIPSAKKVEYDFNIYVVISKEVFFEQEISCPFVVNKAGELSINSSISKEVEEDLNLKINLNYNQLSDALDTL